MFGLFSFVLPFFSFLFPSFLSLLAFLGPFLGESNFFGKGQGGGQRGSTTSRSRMVDRIRLCKFSRHDLDRSHAMYEEIKKKKSSYILASETVPLRSICG